MDEHNLSFAQATMMEGDS